MVTTFPEIVIEEKIENNILTRITYEPTKKWRIAGRGFYNNKPLQSINGRYIVAVGVRIFRKNYPDNGHILDDEFDAFSGEIDVYIKDIDTGEELEEPIKCVRREKT